LSARDSQVLDDATHPGAPRRDLPDRSYCAALGNASLEPDVTAFDVHRDAARVEPRRAGEAGKDVGADLRVAARGPELDPTVVEELSHRHSPSVGQERKGRARPRAAPS
jgi:hypothetical protein